MSTVKTNNVQVGQSATATNNFTWYQPTSPDGTVRLGVGNSGATTLDAISVSNTGTVTAPAFSGSGASLTALNTSNVSSGTLAVANGGTGAATFTANNVLLGNGTSAFQVVAPSTSGNILSSNGTTWTSSSSIASAVTATTQAVKTSDTTLATTAFVDRLRSLLTATTGSGGGTAVIGDRGCLLSVTAGVTVPASVFAANDTFSIYNNSAASITITQGTGLTLRQVGTANTGNRTLALRGLVTVVFISATEAVISGGGLT